MDRFQRLYDQLPDVSPHDEEKFWKSIPLELQRRLCRLGCSDNDENVRFLCAERLYHVYEVADEFRFWTFTSDRSSLVRSSGADGLALFPSERSRKRLMRMLKDSSWLVRGCALTALVRIGVDQDVLLPYFWNEPHPYTQVSMVEDFYQNDELYEWLAGRVACEGSLGRYAAEITVRVDKLRSK